MLESLILHLIWLPWIPSPSFIRKDDSARAGFPCWPSASNWLSIKAAFICSRNRESGSAKRTLPGRESTGSRIPETQRDQKICRAKNGNLLRDSLDPDEYHQIHTMDCPFARNKDLLIRAIELMQSVVSPGESPRFSSDSFPEYGFSEFTYDLQTCGKDEETILVSNAYALSELTIRRKLPTLWLVKTRHPVFAVYAALCTNIKKPMNTAALFLGDNDFPRMTKYGRKLIRSPLL